MIRYIAFLRGINVGGNNKIAMSELKDLFKQHGFQDVLTYINSGNIIFSSEETDILRLNEICETLLLEQFKLKIPVVVLSHAELMTAVDHAPLWWDQDKDSKHNAIIVLPPLTAEEVMKGVGDIKPEYEKVDYFGRVIFWSAPVETFSKTRWSKVVGSKVYDQITIRNANTVKKVVALGNE